VLLFADMSVSYKGQSHNFVNKQVKVLDPKNVKLQYFAVKVSFANDF